MKFVLAILLSVIAVSSALNGHQRASKSLASRMLSAAYYGQQQPQAVRSSPMMSVAVPKIASSRPSYGGQQQIIDNRVALPQVFMPVQPSISQQSYGSYGSPQLSKPTIMDSQDQQSFCVNNQPGDKLSFPGDSSKYIACTEEGNFEVMPCAGFTVFNPTTQQCEHSLRMVTGCASSPCQNGGVCTDLPMFRFKCDCPVGFSGDMCDTSDVCSSNTCGPDAVCLTLPPGSPVAKYCICQRGLTYGLDCQTQSLPNPCLNNADPSKKHFATQINPAIYVQCEGDIPHMRFCNEPLVFNEMLGLCSWTQTGLTFVQEDVNADTSNSNSNSGYGY